MKGAMTNIFRNNKEITITFRFLIVIIMLMFSNTMTVFSQDIKIITGTVVDNKGLPMERATVKMKSSTSVTVTDKDGKFKLKVSSAIKKVILDVSFQGYNKKEVEVVGNEPIKIEMGESIANMTDVIVVDIGYGKVRKKDLTGAVGRVNMEEIEKAPVKSFDDALAGRVAGVQVSSADGEPGSNANIVIRGSGSVTQSTSPLYVIDGFPQEDGAFNSINPADIESIEVLKDASATAIYGARGANGVIIVTTKRGKTPKPKLTYAGNYGTQKAIHLMEVMKPYEFVRLQSDVNPYFANDVYFSGGKTLNDYKNATFLDWQKICMNANPSFQNHSVSISQRKAKTAYTVSGSYTDQQGLIVNSGFTRYQARITMDKTFKEKFKYGINANIASSKSYGQQPSQPSIPPGQTVVNNNWNYMYNLWTFRPVFAGNSAELNNFINNQLIDIEDGVTIPSVNPYIIAMHEINNRLNLTSTANVYLQYNLTKEIIFRSTLGITSIQNKGQVLHDTLTNSGSPQLSYGKTYGVNGSASTINFIGLLNENTVSYSKRFKNKDNLNAVVGFTAQTYSSTGSNYTSTNIPLSAGANVDALSQGIIKNGVFVPGLNRIASFLGRVNYNRGNFLYTFSMRADGSSKFAPENRWGYFPSGAVAWRISNEKFLQKYSFINDAKIRASYGATGNNRVSDFSYSTLLTPSAGSLTYGSNYSFNDSNYYNSLPTQMANPILKWETILQSDLGLDLTLFNKIVISMDYYKKVTKNLLVNVSLPYTSGFSSALENVGSVQNTGFEFSVSTTNIRTKNFTWTTSFNISFNDNKLVSLVSGLDQMLTARNIGQAMNQPNYIARVGKPVAQFYGYIADGMYQYSDFIQVPNGANSFFYILKPGIPYYGVTNTFSSINLPGTSGSTSVQPGDPKFKDINGDGKLDQNDYTAIGRPFPKHFGGFSNNFNYKRFDLSIFTQWSYGNEVLNANRLAMEGGMSASQSGSAFSASTAGMINTNQFAVYANRWTPTNPSNLYPRVNANATGLRQVSTRLIEDASYFRIKTVQIGYNFPVKWIRKIKAEVARVYISGQNLFTFTNYSGPDPEVSTAGASNLTPGFDYSPYPRTRVITLGATLTF